MIENLVQNMALASARALWGEIDNAAVQVAKTRKEFTGDYTVVVFPLLRASRKSPEATAQELGEHIAAAYAEVAGFNVIKGFLNISLSADFWGARLVEIAASPNWGFAAASGRTVMVEYSSPNTNKPLHLGHIRNNLLGWSVASILKANGHNVLKVNLVNDRGIHICKSMLAWQLWGNGETPASSGMKGDHLVGKYYVEFDKHYKAELRELVANGLSEDEAKQRSTLMQQAQAMLRRWEEGDEQVRALWSMMNSWVYEGFDATYKLLGIDFDKIYYESQTYLQGKSLVERGLEMGVFERRADGSVWIDLTADGLDNKLLLRADGTSVYMTQDLGTAQQRFDEFSLNELIYVVGNEQNYHFQVLKLILSKLGYAWADDIFHLSYGMVELPEGKMKSREGTVVDADDLVAGMIDTARDMSAELGKLDGLPAAEAADICRKVGLGALKYFILKVDPKKTMLFDPRESIDFNGNTGPFIQYTHARIRSIMRKSEDGGMSAGAAAAGAPQNTATTPYGADSIQATVSLPAPAEIELIKIIADFPATVHAAGDNFSPALVAQYVYDLAKTFNGYYHDNSILREERAAVRAMRLGLAAEVARTIRRAAALLGIEVPERM